MIVIGFYVSLRVDFCVNKIDHFPLERDITGSFAWVRIQHN